MDAPTPADVRQALADFDDTRQKIVAGMLAVMVKHPQQVRDREWIARQLTELTLAAAEFEADTPQDGVKAVQGYLQANAEGLVTASLLLFERVGLDLAPRAEEGFTFEDAMRCGLEYFPAPAREQEQGRDLGEQPIAALMAERGLKPADLVEASSEQITHKMVTRALKGRRLTANTMDKVHRAFVKASGSAHSRTELFSYEP
jgi:hypothetical protein